MSASAGTGNGTDAGDEGMAGSAGAKVPSTKLRSRSAEWLDVHGGFVLLLGGVVFVALACVFSDRVEVGPLFAVFGAGLLVLSAFYSRIEGPVRATRKGVAFAVRAAQQYAQEQGLPPDLEREAVERAAESVEIQSREPAELRRAGEAAAKEAVDSLESLAKGRHEDLSRAFALWLVNEEGFPAEAVAANVKGSEGEIDLVAEKDDEVVIAEVKTSARLMNAGTVFDLLSKSAPDGGDGRLLRRALVLPQGQRDELRIIEPAEMGGIEIYEVSDDGSVGRL